MHEQVALYARVSSEQQVEDRTIESQISELREYAREQKYEVEEDMVFIDNGVSGSTLIRPALDRLRDKAVEGEVDRILVLCPDRLARKYVHQLLLVEEFQRLGVEIIFVNRAISQSPEDQLLFQIQGVIAEYEREKIMERSRRGKLHLAKIGKVNVLACAPYGYRYTRMPDQGEARYEVYPDESKVVKRMFQMYTMERISLRAVAKRLSSEQIPTPKGAQRWETSSVFRILNNPAYMGQAAYLRTRSVPRKQVNKRARDNGYYAKKSNSSSERRPQEEWIHIPVPKIVSEAVFGKAQQRFVENKRFATRNNKKHCYLLSGLLRCQQCGYGLYGRCKSGKKKSLYYRCGGLDARRHAQGKVCSGHPLRIEILDDLVWKETKQLIEDPELIFHEYSQRLNDTHNGKQHLQLVLAQKQKELRQIHREKQRLLDLCQLGTIPLKDVSNRLANIHNRTKQIEQEQQTLQEESQHQQQQIQLVEKFDSFAKRLHLNLDTLTFTEKKEILR